MAEEQKSEGGKYYLPESSRKTQRASVDGKRIPYGKKNAITLSDSQVDRLKESGVTGLQKA